MSVTKQEFTVQLSLLMRLVGGKEPSRPLDRLLGTLYNSYTGLQKNMRR